MPVSLRPTPANGDAGPQDSESAAATTIAPTSMPRFHRQPSPPPTTRTLPPQVIHHQAIARFKNLLKHVHTEADLEDLNAELDELE